MKKEEFAEILGEVNEKYVTEASTIKKTKKPLWLKWGAAAACLCLVLAGAFALAPDSAPANTPNPPVNEDPQIVWTAHYNEADSMVSADRRYIKGYFTEALTQSELAAVQPEKWYNYMTCSGFAGFDGDGNLQDVILSVATTASENTVSITISDHFFAPCYVLPGDPVVSLCGKVEYKIYQYALGDSITLAADAVIGGHYFHFAVDAEQTNLEQAKADFQRVLECFSCYEEGSPDLVKITAEEIPQLTEQTFTSLSEAQAEPDFGQYLPLTLPAGFGEASIRRYQFQNTNYLSGLWSSGLDDIRWIITPYTPEAAHRLTSVDELKNYDLSLYPIPRAESVPEELHEIVNSPIFEADELTLEAVYRRAYKVNDVGDTSGWRMHFSVKYGDILVEVNTKGVSPEWVYGQLSALNVK